MNQFASEDRLSKALRRLAQESARNAPPDLGSALAGTFRRHHRQRRLKNSAIIVLAIGCLLFTVWFFPKSTATPTTAQNTTKEPAVTSAGASAVSKDTKIERKERQQARVASRHQASREKTQVATLEPGDFLPLPSYDPSVAANRDLQIIRVRMPIQDLRLVGAPVNAAMPNRQVLADFVVGQDGTPYAVRLIQ